MSNEKRILEDITDIFENESLVLMQADLSGAQELSLGLKDAQGDITEIITVCSR